MIAPITGGLIPRMSGLAEAASKPIAPPPPGPKEPSDPIKQRLSEALEAIKILRDNKICDTSGKKGGCCCFDSAITMMSNLLSNGEYSAASLAMSKMLKPFMQSLAQDHQQEALRSVPQALRAFEQITERLPEIRSIPTQLAARAAEEGKKAAETLPAQVTATTEKGIAEKPSALPTAKVVEGNKFLPLVKEVFVIAAERRNERPIPTKIADTSLQFRQSESLMGEAKPLVLSAKVSEQPLFREVSIRVETAPTAGVKAAEGKAATPQSTVAQPLILNGPESKSMAPLPASVSAKNEVSVSVQTARLPGESVGGSAKAPALPSQPTPVLGMASGTSVPTQAAMLAKEGPGNLPQATAVRAEAPVLATVKASGAAKEGPMPVLQAPGTRSEAAIATPTPTPTQAPVGPKEAGAPVQGVTAGQTASVSAQAAPVLKEGPALPAQATGLRGESPVPTGAIISPAVLVSKEGPALPAQPTAVRAEDAHATPVTVQAPVLSKEGMPMPSTAVRTEVAQMTLVTVQAPVLSKEGIPTPSTAVRAGATQPTPVTVQAPVLSKEGMATPSTAARAEAAQPTPVTVQAPVLSKEGMATPSTALRAEVATPTTVSVQAPVVSKEGGRMSTQPAVVATATPTVAMAKETAVLSQTATMSPSPVPAQVQERGGALRAPSEFGFSVKSANDTGSKPTVSREASVSRLESWKETVQTFSRVATERPQQLTLEFKSALTQLIQASGTSSGNASQILQQSPLISLLSVSQMLHPGVWSAVLSALPLLSPAQSAFVTKGMATFPTGQLALVFQVMTEQLCMPVKVFFEQIKDLSPAQLTLLMKGLKEGSEGQIKTLLMKLSTGELKGMNLEAIAALLSTEDEQLDIKKKKKLRELDEKARKKEADQTYYNNLSALFHHLGEKGLQALAEYRYQLSQK